MKIAGAIFDMDGTLLDSMKIWACIGQRYMTKKGINPKEDINHIFMNNRLKNAVTYVKENYHIKESEEDILGEIKEILFEYYMHEMTIKENVMDFLLTLQKDGVKMCVATATYATLAIAALKKAGILEYFEAVYSCHDIGKSKESADIYEVALEKLGTDKKETLVFEDALYAATTAKRAGFPVVGIFDCSEKEQQQLQALVDNYQYNYQDLMIQYNKGWIKTECDNGQ